MAYMLLQTWRAPVSIELHPSGKVAVGGGEIHGCWAIDGAANSLSVCFDDDSQAQSLLFEEVQGTAVMTSKGKKVYYLVPITRPQEILSDATPAPIDPPKKYAFVLLVPGAEPIEFLLGYNLQGQVSVFVGHGESPHGAWLMLSGTESIEVLFHWNGNAVRAERGVFTRVKGTDVWQKVNGDRRYICFMCLKRDELESRIQMRA